MRSYPGDRRFRPRLAQARTFMDAAPFPAHAAALGSRILCANDTFYDTLPYLRRGHTTSMIRVVGHPEAPSYFPEWEALAGAVAKLLWDSFLSRPNDPKLWEEVAYLFRDKRLRVLGGKQSRRGRLSADTHMPVRMPDIGVVDVSVTATPLNEALTLVMWMPPWCDALLKFEGNGSR
jgi:hypothetical protein